MPRAKLLRLYRSKSVDLSERLAIASKRLEHTGPPMSGGKCRAMARAKHLCLDRGKGVDLSERFAIAPKRLEGACADKFSSEGKPIANRMGMVFLYIKNVIGPLQTFCSTP